MDRIDEAVVIAMDARRRSYGRTTLGSKEAQDFEAMRAALLAALPVLLGEPVAWKSSITGAMTVNPAWYHAAPNRWTPLYAPDLGGGK